MRKVRQSHTKSRLGCQTCKRRKIKCDEVRPQCGNCTRFGVPCDYSPIPLRSINSLQSSVSASRSTRRGRPRSNWADWAEQIRLSSAASAPRLCACSTKQLNIEGFELFHNFVTNTAQTIDDDTKLWSEGVPKLSFQYPCILNLMLALSSYQLARLRPHNAARYLELAEDHSTAALQAATELLKNLSTESSAPLYATAVLICFAALAKGPTPGHLLLVAEHGQVSWLPLLGGVKLVVSSTGWSSIFSGTLAEYQPQPKEEPEKSPPPLLLAVGVEDWRSYLHEISDLIAVLTEEQVRVAYEHELKVLVECFESTFGRGQHARQNIDGKMQVVMSWVYQLDDTFVQQLDKKDPMALIILGCFCVLLSTVERYWFLEGWARHTMREILSVSDACQKWLSWPVQYLSGNSARIESLEQSRRSETVC